LDAAHGAEVERAASIPPLRSRSEMEQTLGERNKQLALKAFFERVRSFPATFRYENALAVADGDYVIL
jgi:hypothetical protein